MCGKHRCPVAQLVPPGFPSPGRCFTLPVAIPLLPGDRNVRNSTWELLGVTAQSGVRRGQRGWISIARQHKEFPTLLFLGKKGREKGPRASWERGVLAPAPEKPAQLRDGESQNILGWE